MIQFYADFSAASRWGSRRRSRHNAAVQSMPGVLALELPRIADVRFRIDSTFHAFFYNLLDITF